MDLEKTSLIDLETAQPVMTARSVVLLLASMVMGVFVAAVIVPAWLPGLADSLYGTGPKVFWYLSRSSAVVSFALLWFSMALGLIISNKMARLWPGGPVAFDLHQYTSLLGLAFALFHGLILIGDGFIGYTLSQLIIPFASVNYRPIWVGLGQVGFYVWAVVAFSFYVRKRIGTRTWRTLHFASFALFVLALLHGVTSGTDASSVWVLRLYWYSGASLLFLIVYRILVNPKIWKRNPAQPSLATTASQPSVVSTASQPSIASTASQPSVASSASPQ